ncbi:MAG: hypothetical protein K6G90_02255 [Clostridia bacterium]|nr:hypothetical protein [Clostridia bacterium]
MAAKEPDLKEASNGILMYKDKPLVRVGNIVYYGYRSDPYSIEIEILSTEKALDASGSETGLDLSDRVSLRLMRNEPDGTQTVMSSAEQNGLSGAIDIARSWLARFSR